MQTKGFIRVITVALILICCFYLSFSFVANKIENEAVAQAMSDADITNLDNENDSAKLAVYKESYNNIIRAKEGEKVYLGYTYKQVRENQLGLGLDLKGGMSVTLQISVPDILRALSEENNDKTFNDAIDAVAKQKNAPEDFVDAFVEEYERQGANRDNLKNIFSNVSDIQSRHGDISANEVISILKKEVEGMVDASYNVLRQRIDAFGVVAPNIQKLQSTGRIQLELPGIKEPERVKELLKKAANLEFYETYLLSEVRDRLAQMPELMKLLANSWGREDYCIVAYVNMADTLAVNKVLREAPQMSGLKLAWGVKPNDDNKLELYALKTDADGKAAMSGEVVTEASTEFEKAKGQTVNMRMNDDGARQWSRLTGNNIGRPVAIALDNQVYSAPNVNQKIDGGSSEITGRFSIEEANDLVNVLKSGKMVAGVDIVSESVIGPSLGQEAINKGLISFIVALILLMIFMWFFYGFKAGSIANLGLIMNLFFTFGILASFRAVLTLPGIAGIVLALGMAVDANVLIFERIKEELRAGKGLKAAVADGYKNAFSAIFDGNLTTIITGIILAVVGSGPIRGFAVTLIVGICCSFFTAVFATRLVMEHFVNNGKFANMTLSNKWTRNWMTNTHFNIIGARRRSLITVICVVIAGVALLFTLGLNRGIEFTGGRNYVVQFEQPVTPSELESKLSEELEGANVSVITIDNNTKVRVSTNYKIDENDASIDEEVKGKMFKAFESELNGMSEEDFSLSNEKVGVVQSDVVGPSMAADMTRSAIWAVVLSLIAMALYILLRFRNIAFSIGALAAVAFTAFTVIAFYNFHGIFPFSMEIDQTFIAAILTVIGYQVNDTVVVFDRVREYRRLYPKQNALETFNNALNSTLSRTMMTSLSTLLVLFVIFIFGGESIRSFNFAMILGVIIGTAASLFVAAPTAYVIANRNKDKKVDEATKPAKK